MLVHRYFELEDPPRCDRSASSCASSATVGSVQLRGIIDRLELVENDELVITDYKTGSVPGERHELQRLAGVHMYALMVEQMLGKRPVRVQLLYLSKPEAIIATPSEQSVTGVARKSQALWTAIQSSCARDDFRPHPGPLCNYCSYQAYCPAFGGDPARADELRGPGTVIAPPLPLASTPGLGATLASMAPAFRLPSPEELPAVQAFDRAVDAWLESIRNPVLDRGDVHARRARPTTACCGSASAACARCAAATSGSR